MKQNNSITCRLLPLASASVLALASIESAAAVSVIIPPIKLAGSNGLVDLYEVDFDGSVGYSVDILNDSELVVQTLVVSYYSRPRSMDTAPMEMILSGSFPSESFDVRYDLGGTVEGPWGAESWVKVSQSFLGLNAISFEEAFNAEDNAFFIIQLGSLMTMSPTIKEFESEPVVMRDVEPTVREVFGINAENDIDGPPSPGDDFHFYRGGFPASDFIVLDETGMVISSSSGAFSAIPEPSGSLLLSLVMGSGMMFRFRPRR